MRLSRIQSPATFLPPCHPTHQKWPLSMESSMRRRPWALPDIATNRASKIYRVLGNWLQESRRNLAFSISWFLCESQWVEANGQEVGVSELQLEEGCLVSCSIQSNPSSQDLDLLTFNNHLGDSFQIKYICIYKILAPSLYVVIMPKLCLWRLWINWSPKLYF